tara:strand:- start:59033 stop:59146 length:114 start_codon:yes stop_codon:yes gene_type:complete
MNLNAFSSCLKMKRLPKAKLMKNNSTCFIFEKRAKFS